jgi:hypothetical protein
MVVDWDNDGFPDLFVATGSVYPEVERHFATSPLRHCTDDLFGILWSQRGVLLGLSQQRFKTGIIVKGLQVKLGAHLRGVRVPVIDCFPEMIESFVTVSCLSGALGIGIPRVRESILSRMAFRHQKTLGV